ncbi:LysM domain-containing protein [Lachnospiraceae bacterium 66-29]
MARIIPIPIGPIFPGGSCGGIIHVIQKGDTLYQLGKRYHVSVGQLMFANPFVDVYNLQIGDELCIPATIQPRAVGAGERQQFTNMDSERMPRDWEEMSDSNTANNWNGMQQPGNWDDREELPNQEEWNDRENMQNWANEEDMSNRPNWANEEDMSDRPNWNDQKEMPGQENWIDQEEVFSRKSMDEI